MQRQAAFQFSKRNVVLSLNVIPGLLKKWFVNIEETGMMP